MRVYHTIKNIVIFSLWFSLVNIALGARVSEQILDIIKEEKFEIQRLLKTSSQSERENLEIRLCELMLEEARIVEEGENEAYLNIPNTKRSKISKESFFKKSRKGFLDTQKYAVYLLKKYPRLKTRPEIFYILAFNEKEYGSSDKAVSYFKKTIQLSRNAPLTQGKSEIALAEIYYNKKNYGNAVKLYESGLTKVRDKWWTKDSYNLAWSYYNNKQQSKAIQLLENVLQEGKSGKYIDMSPLVKRDLTFFYSNTQNTRKAVQLYKEDGKSDVAVKQILRNAKILIDQGKFTQAERLLKQLLQEQMSDVMRIETLITLSIVYDRFDKFEKNLGNLNFIFDILKKTPSLALNTEQKKILNYQIQRSAATLQKQVASKAYHGNPGILKGKAQLIAGFLSLYLFIDAKNAYKSYFHTGETYYTAEMYEEAARFYKDAYQEAKRVQEGKYQDAALKGMIASLSKWKGASEKKEQMIQESYMLFLADYPTAPKSEIIYQRLFASLIRGNKIEEAEKMLDRYVQSFKGEKSKLSQEAMLAKILDIYKGKKDINSMRRMVAKINQGLYQTNSKLAKEINKFMLSLQFEDVERKNSNGNKMEALKGYIELYRSADTLPDGKKNAAYNIAILFYEIGDMVRSGQWVQHALKMMNDQDVLNYESSLFLVTLGLSEVEKFSQATQVSAEILQRLCRMPSSKRAKSLIRNPVVSLLAINNPNEAISFLNKHSSCLRSAKEENRLRNLIAKYFSEEKQWQNLERFLNLHPLLWATEEGALYAYHLANAYLNVGNRAKADQYKSTFISKIKELGSKKGIQHKEVRSLYGRMVFNDLSRVRAQMENLSFQFPEQTFNSQVQQSLALLQQAMDIGGKVLNYADSNLVGTVYYEISKSYDAIISKIDAFNPTGVSADYQVSFKKSMIQLTDQLRQRKKEFLQEGKRKIEKEQIFSPTLSFLFRDLDIPQLEGELSSPDFIMMDGQGKI